MGVSGPMLGSGDITVNKTETSQCREGDRKETGLLPILVSLDCHNKGP